MEMKASLTISTYKQLSKKNGGWKEVYVAENPWKEMAVDVDSLIFFFMRKYLDIPYPPRKERLVMSAFLLDTRQSTQWVIDDMAKYCVAHLSSLLRYLESIGLVLHPIYSTGYPKLKRELRDERLLVRNEMEREFQQMDPSSEILLSMKKYILHFRDEVRDVVVKNKKLQHLRSSTEADKWCGKNHRITISEDVDIFLFGNKKTIIVKPFLETPEYFRFMDCKSYFTNKGIKTYDDFIQVAFMMGTDYNRGIKGMGEKRSVEAIAKHGTVARYVAAKYDITDDNVARLMSKYRRFIEYVNT